MMDTLPNNHMNRPLLWLYSPLMSMVYSWSSQAGRCLYLPHSLSSTSCWGDNQGEVNTLSEFAVWVTVLPALTLSVRLAHNHHTLVPPLPFHANLRFCFINLADICKQHTVQQVLFVEWWHCADRKQRCEVCQNLKAPPSICGYPML